MTTYPKRIAQDPLSVLFPAVIGVLFFSMHFTFVPTNWRWLPIICCVFILALLVLRLKDSYSYWEIKGKYLRLRKNLTDQLLELQYPASTTSRGVENT